MNQIMKQKEQVFRLFCFTKCLTGAILGKFYEGLERLLHLHRSHTMTDCVYVGASVFKNVFAFLNALLNSGWSSGPQPGGTWLPKRGIISRGKKLVSTREIGRKNQVLGERIGKEKAL